METYSSHLSGARPLQGQMKGMERVLPLRSCHSLLLFLAIRSQSRVTVDPPVETDPERVNAVMLRSRPLTGDNGLTLPLSDVYYIQVHLSFRGSWPRVTPRAISRELLAGRRRYRVILGPTDRKMALQNRTAVRT